MARKNIPRDDWCDFLESLSLENEGWLLSVERIGDIEPDQDLEHESTLDAIDFDIGEGVSTVSVAFVDNKPIHLDDVVRIYLDDTDEQGGKIIELEARDQTLRLWFRLPPDAEHEDFLEADLKDQRGEPPAAEEALAEKSYR